jgi:hypothetical protein
MRCRRLGPEPADRARAIARIRGARRARPAARVADDVADRLGLDAWASNAGISFMQRFLDMPIED